ncbi:hypothetical protein N493_07315 [Clostridium botulinum B2 433]|uniref:coiled-coil domain-containing protein n=1 Tax=Clostridium botulinum TaxID=1491 RepID=UPI0007DE5538|nr:hypothetical protein [Clostridium botulinum]KEI89313.1 hypothetical protein N493_07315 [Clostridium botulinum B2 433]
MENILKNEVKIMCLEGSSILKNNKKNEIINKIYNINFNKSLLLNHIIDLGLNVSKMNTTRDIVNVRFSYGYDKDAKKIKLLEDKIMELKQEKQESIDGDELYKDTKGKTKIINSRREERKETNEEIKELEKQIEELKLNKDDVREQLYKNGFFWIIIELRKMKIRGLLKR